MDCDEIETEATKNMKEKKIIEKLDYKLNNIQASYEESWLMNCIEANKNKINEIIDVINKNYKQ